MSGQPVFSTATVLKAERLLGRKNDAGHALVLRDPELPSVWWVESSAADRRYRVQTDWNPETLTLTWINCTCPHGANKGGGQCRCYHAAAVLMLLRDEKLAEEHQPLVLDPTRASEGCTCGWPQSSDYNAHTPKWKPKFAEHLLDERRRLA